MKMLRCRSVCFVGLPIFVLIVLTIISICLYRIYLFNREKDLKKLIESLKQFPIEENIEKKQFHFEDLPIKLKESIEEYLSIDYENYLIINCETGLGNRLQSIVSAFIFALVSKRRLLIHWSSNKLSGCYFNKLFVSPISMSSILLKSYNEQYLIDHSEQISFHGPFDELLCQEDLTLFKKKSQFLFVSTDEYFVSVILKNQFYNKNLFLNVNEDLLFKNLVNYLFEPKKELKEQIKFYELKHGYCHKGIHMRKQGLKQIQINGEQQFLNCLLNRTNSSKENWFIASDYPPYKDYFRLNVNSKKIKINSLESSGQTKECFDVQQALIELWLLSKCEKLYLTEWSSFSWLSSGLSGIHPYIVQSNSCHLQPFSRPCYYELTHLKQLSCFHFKQMFSTDQCCLSEGFCGKHCLHHDYKYGSHQFYFLMIWPTFKLIKWFTKWILLIFFIVFLINQLKSYWTINIYKKFLLIIIYLSILFVNIRCLFWSKQKIL